MPENAKEIEKPDFLNQASAGRTQPSLTLCLVKKLFAAVSNKNRRAQRKLRAGFSACPKLFYEVYFSLVNTHRPPLCLVAIRLPAVPDFIKILKPGLAGEKGSKAHRRYHPEPGCIRSDIY
jgi:hypothetical protein